MYNPAFNYLLLINIITVGFILAEMCWFGLKRDFIDEDGSKYYGMIIYFWIIILVAAVIISVIEYWHKRNDGDIYY